MKRNQSQREALRDDAVRLRDILREVRRANSDGRSFALFDARDALQALGIDADMIDGFDAGDDAALDHHIDQAHAVATALGAADDTSCSGWLDDLPMSPDRYSHETISVTGQRMSSGEDEAARVGLRGPQLGPGQIYHRTPIERFNDGWRYGGRTKFGTSGLLAAHRAAMPPERAALAEQRYQASMDAYEKRQRNDPWDQAPGNLLDKANAGAWTFGGHLLGNGEAIIEKLVRDPTDYLPGGKIVKAVIGTGVDALKDGVTDRFNGR